MDYFIFWLFRATLRKDSEIALVASLWRDSMEKVNKVIFKLDTSSLKVIN